MKNILLKLSLICILTFASLIAISQSTCLVAQYDLDGNANEVSSSSLNGIVYGATPTTDRNGNVNSAYDFDGVDNYIDLGSDFDLAERTYSFWFNTDNTLALPAQVMFGVNHASLTNMFISIGVRNDGGVHTLRVNMGTSSNFYSQTIDLNTWYHVAVSTSLTETKVYIDGILVNTGTDMTALHAMDGDIPARLGAHRYFQSNTFFDGQIDDVQIFDCALTDAEVAALCPVGQTTDINNEIASNNLDLIVHPNPVVDILTIKLTNQNSSYKAQLVSYTGQILQELDIQEETTSIDVSQLAQGMYNVVLVDKSTGERTAVERVSIIH